MNGQKIIKLLVVDDSFLIRKIIIELLKDEVAISVVGEAFDGEDAVRKISELKPDVVTLDYNMPKLNGLGTIKRIKETILKQPAIIMVSAMTTQGANETFECLKNGAVDFIPKPSGELSIDIKKIQEELIKKIYLASSIEFSENKKYLKPEKTKIIKEGVTVEAVVIGASTGGPPLVEEIITDLPLDIKSTIFVVQHMPKHFTKSFADRLNGLTKLEVKEAVDGDIIKKGVCYIAAGDWHMLIEKNRNNEKVIKFNDEPLVNGFRPSIDVTMISASKAYGNSIMGVVLTGMGNDGAGGIAKLKDAGGLTYVQDPQSALISSMPDAAIKTGKVDEVLSLNELIKKIIVLSK